MSKLEKAEEIAERLRQEPYVLFKSDCVTKSIKFKRECKAVGISASAVACIGLAKARLLRRWFTIPVIHGWGEAEGKRIETSRPLGASGLWGIIPMNIKPVIAVWF